MILDSHFHLHSFIDLFIFLCLIFFPIAFPYHHQGRVGGGYGVIGKEHDLSIMSQKCETGEQIPLFFVTPLRTLDEKLPVLMGLRLETVLHRWLRGVAETRTLYAFP